MRHCTIAFFALFFAQAAQAQHSYISCDSAIVIEVGSIVSYDMPDIYVDARYYTLEEKWVATIRLVEAGATTNFAAMLDISFTQTAVDSYTGSGATETRTIQNTILQAVAGYLGDLNPGVTFTLH